MFHADEDPNLLLHWIAENLPKAYIDHDDIAHAYESLSNADIYLSRTMRRNNYGFWAYATDEMSLGVALSKTQQSQHTTYSFPSWLKYAKNRRTIYSEEKELIQKLSLNYHCSTNKISNHYLPYLKHIISKEPLVAETLAKKIPLTDDELKYLGATKRQTKKKEDTTILTSNEIQKEENNEGDEQRQQSLLLDF